MQTVKRNTDSNINLPLNMISCKLVGRYPITCHHICSNMVLSPLTTAVSLSIGKVLKISQYQSESKGGLEWIHSIRMHFLVSKRSLSQSRNWLADKAMPLAGRPSKKNPGFFLLNITLKYHPCTMPPIPELFNGRIMPKTMHERSNFTLAFESDYYSSYSEYVG